MCLSPWNRELKLKSGKLKIDRKVIISMWNDNPLTTISYCSKNMWAQSLFGNLLLYCTRLEYVGSIAVWALTAILYRSRTCGLNRCLATYRYIVSVWNMWAQLLSGHLPLYCTGLEHVGSIAVWELTSILYRSRTSGLIPCLATSDIPLKNDPPSATVNLEVSINMTNMTCI